MVLVWATLVLRDSFEKSAMRLLAFRVVMERVPLEALVTVAVAVAPRGVVWLTPWKSMAPPQALTGPEKCTVMESDPTPEGIVP